MSFTNKVYGKGRAATLEFLATERDGGHAEWSRAVFIKFRRPDIRAIRIATSEDSLLVFIVPVWRWKALRVRIRSYRNVKHVNKVWSPSYWILWGVHDYKQEYQEMLDSNNGNPWEGEA